MVLPPAPQPPAAASVRGFPIYGAFLHIALIGLAVVTLLLMRDNRELRSQLPPPAEPRIVEGDVVSPFRVLEQDGTETVVDASAHGNQDRLLFFFTTTCPVCRDNQPRWSELHGRVANRMDVVGVSLDDPEQTRSYLEGLEIPFRVVTVIDPQSFVREQGVDLVPLTVHVGADGAVRDSWLGPLPENVVARL